MVRIDGQGDGSSLIQVRGIDKTYQRGSEEIHVLQGLNLDVDAGDFVAFMGPSGSGKTTLLNLLGGLDLPSAGSITVAGDEITRLSARQLTAWRARHVGFVFQMYNLIPVLTAFQNVELPLLLTRLSKAERRQHVETALEVVGLADRMHHYPRQLSGGQEQRVGIARAIVADPTFLLCDEPTGDLDRKSADEILDLLGRLVQEHGKTVLMVTHDPLAAERAHVVVHLEKGVLVDAVTDGTGPDEVPASRPAQPAQEEDPDRPDDGLLRGRPLPVRHPGRGPRRVPAGRGRGRRRPAGGGEQGLDHPAAAACLPRPAGAHPRGHAGDLRQLVRRCLPGRAQLLSAVRHRSRDLPADVPGVRHPR